MPSIAEWRESQERIAAALAPAQQEQLRRAQGEFARAALDMSQVTSIPQWDQFSTYVNGWIFEIERGNAALRRTLESDSEFDSAVIARAREMLVRNNIRIDTLRKVIAFPQTIMNEAASQQPMTAQEEQNG